MTLQGKNMFITGASEGIGKAVAYAAATRGAQVFLASRSADKLQKLEQELKQQGYQAHAIVLDVAQQRAVHKAIHDLEKGGHFIDIIINNAGVGLFSTIEDTASEDAARVLETNVLGPLHCMRAVLPQMKKRHSGMIVNITSAIGKHAAFYQGIYAGSKAALERLSEALRIEEAGNGIHVLTISLDRTKTNFREHLLAGKEKYVLPFGSGSWSTPERVAERILEAIERKKHFAHTSWKSWVFAKVAGAFPQVVHALFTQEYQKQTRKEREREDLSKMRRNS